MGATIPDLMLEHRHAGAVCGVDEAGRGPWAGPVVAAAVILDAAALPKGINDSKKLTAAKRAALFLELRETAQIGVGAASVAEISALNILQASLLAMRRAVLALPRRPAMALIDGKFCPTGLPCPAEAVVDGDARSLSIAAASIIAKVIRDRVMEKLDARHPGFAWATNKGYGTPAHQAGLQALGPTRHHRLDFAPLRAYRHQI